MPSCGFVFLLYVIYNPECLSLRFQEGLGLFQNVIKLCRNIASEDIQKRKESIFTIADSFEGFVLNYSHHHLKESTTEINVVSNGLGEWTCHFARYSIVTVRHA